MNKFHFFLPISLFFILITHLAAADPNIDSISFNGNEINIAGDSFGSKVPAAPLLWDTFEGGNVDSVIQNVSATIGNWESGAGSDNVFYSNSLSYGGSKSARHNFTGAKWNSSLSINEIFSVAYIDFKRFLPNTGTSGNYKPFRFYGDSDTMEYFTGYGCSSGSPYGVSTMRHSSLSTTEWHGHPTKGVWQHYQIIFKESAPNTSNGTIIQYIDGSAYGFDTNSQETRNTSGAHLDQLRIGHYMDVGTRDGCTIPDPTYVYTDNVYVDTTWARIEIGNNSNYNNCTLKEIQIPSAWSNDSITATTNYGAFSEGQVAYLFVIDGNGNASQGYPITIGGGAGAPTSISTPVGFSAGQ